MTPIEKVKKTLDDLIICQDHDTETLKCIREALRELEGMVLVPIEPTGQMAVDGWETLPSIDSMDSEIAEKCYAAMIAPYLPKGDE